MNCASLQSITIPDTVTTISQGSLAQCKAMTVMNIPASVETIDLYQTLWDQLSMTAYNVDPDNENYSSDGKTLKEIPYRDTAHYVSQVSRTKEIYESLYRKG